MAQVNFNDVQDVINSNQSNNGDFAVSYFSLKNNGDEAIVRINYSDVSQFKLMTVHTEKINVNGRSFPRKVNCLRGPKDPTSLCPLCESGSPSRTSFYIPMIQYMIDPNTHAVTYKHVMWERSMSYAARLKSLMEEYGPLTDCIFKIKRVGEAGSRDTTYEIMYGNEKMYPEDVFVKDFSAFDNYNVLGTMVMDKTYEEMVEFINTGSFPMKNNNTTNYTNSTNANTGSTSNVPWERNTQQTNFVPTQPQYTPKENPPTNFSQPTANTTSNFSNPPVRNTPPVRQVETPTTNNVQGPPQRTTRYY